jgi:hypothetical protein
MSAKIENWQDIKELALMSIGTDKGSWRADPGFGSGRKSAMRIYFWSFASGKTTRMDTRRGRLPAGQVPLVWPDKSSPSRRMLRECLGRLARDGLRASADARAERQTRRFVYRYPLQTGRGKRGYSGGAECRLAGTASRRFLAACTRITCLFSSRLIKRPA